ncbi:hypothetical protein MA16_Dca021438 [Dendrobium catenatum]|uniref:Reverse transcriptase domain-containing protein n=1 Tax=Dendrobium catenatum TaxID=906689 RepID=A0A2I0WBV8_9ASPA|nr:hypothetical protein MA16_Dca021438 [Dendrobium catenatum]
MPFGLKNAGVTYQRIMNKVFKTFIGCNMEVYVDDMLVKSLEKSQHISDLEQCFRLLRHYNMQLNPAKCAFGVTSGKFLGFMVTHRGIEANPKKIKALRDIVPPEEHQGSPKAERENCSIIIFSGAFRRQILAFLQSTHRCPQLWFPMDGQMPRSLRTATKVFGFPATTF